MAKQHDACFICAQLGHWAAECPTKRKRDDRPRKGGIIGTVIDECADGSVTVELNMTNMAAVNHGTNWEGPSSEAQLQAATRLWKQLLGVNRSHYEDAGLVMEGWLQEVVSHAEAIAMLAFLGFDAAGVPFTPRHYRLTHHNITITAGPNTVRIDRAEAAELDNLATGPSAQSPARALVQGNLGRQLNELEQALQALDEEAGND